MSTTAIRSWPRYSTRSPEEGWGNDSVGDLDEDGFHASLLIVEPAEQQELSEAFDRDVPAGN